MRPLCQGAGVSAIFGLAPKAAGADLPLTPGLGLRSMSGSCVPAGTATYASDTVTVSHASVTITSNKNKAGTAACGVGEGTARI